MYSYVKPPAYYYSDPIAEFNALRRGKQFAQKLYEMERGVARSGAARKVRGMAGDAVRGVRRGFNEYAQNMARRRQAAEALAGGFYYPGAMSESVISKGFREQASRNPVALRDPRTIAAAAAPSNPTALGGTVSPRDPSAAASTVRSRGGSMAAVPQERTLGQVAADPEDIRLRRGKVTPDQRDLPQTTNQPTRLSTGDPMPISAADVPAPTRNPADRPENLLGGRGRTPAEVQSEDLKAQGAEGSTGIPQTRSGRTTPKPQSDVVQVRAGRDGRRAHTRKRNQTAPQQQQQQQRQGLSPLAIAGIATGGTALLGAGIGIPLASSMQRQRERARDTAIRAAEQQEMDAYRYAYGDYRSTPRTANFMRGGLGAIKKPQGILGRRFKGRPDGLLTALEPDKRNLRRGRFIRRRPEVSLIPWF